MKIIFQVALAYLLTYHFFSFAVTQKQQEEIDTALQQINLEYQDASNEMCIKKPSPTYCRYICFPKDDGNQLACIWPNGKTFLFKKIHEE